MVISPSIRDDELTVLLIVLDLDDLSPPWNEKCVCFNCKLAYSFIATCRERGGSDLFCTKYVNIVISALISVRWIFGQVQVFDTETHRSDNLQIENMSGTSVYVEETAW